MMKFEDYQKEVYKRRFDKDRMKNFIENLIILREFNEKDEVIKEEYLEKEEFMDKIEVLFLLFKDKDFAKNKRVTVSLLKIGEEFDRYFDNNCQEHLLKDYKDMWIFGLNKTHTDVVVTHNEVKFYEKSPRQFENCNHISELTDCIIKNINKLKEKNIYSYLNLDIYNDKELKNGNVNSYIFYADDRENNERVSFNETNIKLLYVKIYNYLLKKGIHDMDSKYALFLDNIAKKHNKIESIIDIENINIRPDFQVKDLEFITIKKDSKIRKIKLLSSTNGANMLSVFNEDNEEWYRNCNEINLGLALGLKNFLENYYKVYDEEKSE
jgi:hypothetical protein